MIGGKFAPLTVMNSEDADMDSIITTFNTEMTETFLANTVRRRNSGSLSIFLICARKGENGERSDSNLKNLRNTGK